MSAPTKTGCPWETPVPRQGDSKCGQLHFPPWSPLTSCWVALPLTAGTHAASGHKQEASYPTGAPATPAPQGFCSLTSSLGRRSFWSVTSAGAQHREGGDVTDTGLGKWPRIQPCAPSEQATGAWATQTVPVACKALEAAKSGHRPPPLVAPSCGASRPSPATLALPPA